MDHTIDRPRARAVVRRICDLLEEDDLDYHEALYVALCLVATVWVNSELTGVYLVESIESMVTTALAAREEEAERSTPVNSSGGEA